MICYLGVKLLTVSDQLSHTWIKRHCNKKQRPGKPASLLPLAECFLITLVLTRTSTRKEKEITSSSFGKCLVVKTVEINGLNIYSGLYFTLGDFNFCLPQADSIKLIIQKSTSAESLLEPSRRSWSFVDVSTDKWVFRFRLMLSG